jgi:sulfur carrier protein
MQISVNGEEMKVSPGFTIGNLLNLLELTPERLAVERNGMVISRKLLTETILEEGDKLEIVKAIGGG